jgi:hypothetical protein
VNIDRGDFVSFKKNTDALKAMALLVDTIALNEKFSTSIWTTALFAIIAAIHHEQELPHEAFKENMKHAAEHYKILWD